MSSEKKKHSGIRKEQTRERFFEGLDETRVLLGFKGSYLLSCCWFSRSDKHEEEHRGFCFCSVWFGLVWSGSDLWSVSLWTWWFSMNICHVIQMFVLIDVDHPVVSSLLVSLMILSLQLSPLGILSLASSLSFYRQNHN